MRVAVLSDIHGHLPALDFFLRQTYGDDEAIRVFGPRDGRQPET